MELLALPDAQAVATAVAERVCQAQQAELPKPLGLATGRTMEPVYAALRLQLGRLRPQERQAIRDGWLSFNLDEYVGLAADDPRSFAAFMADQLQRPLGLRADQVRLPDGLATDPQAEAHRYATALAAAGGLGLQLLGLGGNGHVGFNEPPCAAEAPCRCLELSPATRAQNAGAFGGDAGAVPARAITLGMLEILAAERILLVVTGAAKAGILRRVLEEPPHDNLPASWLQGHPAVTVIADAAALAG